MVAAATAQAAVAAMIKAMAAVVAMATVAAMEVVVMEAEATVQAAVVADTTKAIKVGPPCGAAFVALHDSLYIECDWEVG